MLFEIIVILFLGIAVEVQSNRKDSMIDVSLSDWKTTRYFVHNTDGWYVDKTMVQANSGDKPICLYGSYVGLSRGTYSVQIEYECENDQTCQIYANDIKNSYIKGRAGKLSKNYKEMSFEFMLAEDIDNFEFVVNYNKSGYLWVKNIEIRRNAVGLQKVLAIAVLLSLVIDFCLFYKGKKWFLCKSAKLLSV